MSVSGLIIPEEDLPVVRKALEIARDMCPASIGDSAQSVLDYMDESEANEENYR